MSELSVRSQDAVARSNTTNHSRSERATTHPSRQRKPEGSSVPGSPALAAVGTGRCVLVGATSSPRIARRIRPAFAARRAFPSGSGRSSGSVTCAPARPAYTVTLRSFPTTA